MSKRSWGRLAILMVVVTTLNSVVEMVPNAILAAGVTDPDALKLIFNCVMDFALGFHSWAIFDYLGILKEDDKSTVR